MLLADDIYCLYVIIAMFRNKTKDSFWFDLENTSIKIYHSENGSLRIVKWFWLLKQ